MARPSTVLVPLYIWPTSESTWQPLFEAIQEHSSVNFVVVINPNSGPGTAALPGHDYEREVPKLNALPNVRTVGYVLVDYCRRPLHEVCGDIDRYAGWARDFDGTRLGVQGIFLDETPNHHSTGRALYLEALSRYIKAKDGLMGERMVLHNPGTPPDAGLAASETGADVVITCEEPYERFAEAGGEVQRRLADYPHSPSRSGYMVSGVPRDAVSSTARELGTRGAFVFATDLQHDFYESFGDSWRQFVAAVAGA